MKSQLKATIGSKWNCGAAAGLASLLIAVGTAAGQPLLQIADLPNGHIRLSAPETPGQRLFYQQASRGLNDWLWTGFSVPGNTNAVFDAAESPSGFFRGVSLAVAPTDEFAVLPVNSTSNELAVFNVPAGLRFVVEYRDHGNTWLALGQGSTTGSGITNGVGQLALPSPVPSELRLRFVPAYRGEQINVATAAFADLMTFGNGPYILRVLENGQIYDPPTAILEHFLKLEPPKDVRPHSQPGAITWPNYFILTIENLVKINPSKYKVYSYRFVGDTIAQYLHTVELVGGVWTSTDFQFDPRGF